MRIEDPRTVSFISAMESFVLFGQVNGFCVKIFECTVISKPVCDKVNTIRVKLQSVTTTSIQIGVQGTPLKLHGVTETAVVPLDY